VETLDRPSWTEEELVDIYGSLMRPVEDPSSSRSQQRPLASLLEASAQNLESFLDQLKVLTDTSVSSTTTSLSSRLRQGQEDAADQNVPVDTKVQSTRQDVLRRLEHLIESNEWVTQDTSIRVPIGHKDQFVALVTESAREEGAQGAINAMDVIKVNFCLKFSV
jgi:hypothetical protein